MTNQRDFLGTRNALVAGHLDQIIHRALIDLAQYRPLTRTEIRLRCAVKLRPWLAAGVSPSTFYRRRARERLAANIAGALQ